MALRGANIEVIYLGNRRVIPGLNDSQMQPIRGGVNYNMELRWDGVPSLADALRMLKEQAQRIPPEWVPVVGGSTEFQFAERHMPTLEVFQMEYGPPQRLRLTLFMSDKEPVWNRLVKKHSLLDYTFQEAAASKQ